MMPKTLLISTRIVKDLRKRDKLSSPLPVNLVFHSCSNCPSVLLLDDQTSN